MSGESTRIIDLFRSLNASFTCLGCTFPKGEKDTLQTVHKLCLMHTGTGWNLMFWEHHTPHLSSRVWPWPQTDATCSPAASRWSSRLICWFHFHPAAADACTGPPRTPEPLGRSTDAGLWGQLSSLFRIINQHLCQSKPVWLYSECLVVPKKWQTNTEIYSRRTRF